MLTERSPGRTGRDHRAQRRNVRGHGDAGPPGEQRAKRRAVTELARRTRQELPGDGDERDNRLTGPGVLSVLGVGVGTGVMPGRLRAPVGKLYDEPGSKTRLELWQGPFAEDQEATARAWWIAP